MRGVGSKLMRCSAPPGSASCRATGMFENALKPAGTSADRRNAARNTGSSQHGSNSRADAGSCSVASRRLLPAAVA